MQFTGLPFFAPELFYTVDTADPLRAKQLRAGLKELGEEGAIQVFQMQQGKGLLLGAIGGLQFEVVMHRLKQEYGVEARLTPAKYRVARWVTAPSTALLSQFIQTNEHRIAWDVVNAPAFVASGKAELAVAQERWKDIQFHSMREHSGLVCQSTAQINS